MKREIEFPDCPKCGQEMKPKIKYKELDDGGFYYVPLFHFECERCDLKSPYSDFDNFIDVANKWSEERRYIL